MRAVRLALAICASITTILTALACSAAEQSDDELDSLYRQARELVRARKFDEAIPITEQALALAEGRSGPDHSGTRRLEDPGAVRRLEPHFVVANVSHGPRPLSLTLYARHRLTTESIRACVRVSLQLKRTP